MEPIQIGKKYYLRFTFLGKQYRFSLKTSNLKLAQQITDQIQRGIERGIFDSFEKGGDGEGIVKQLIARPGLRAEDYLQELQSNGKRKLLKEAVQEYLESCKTEHSPKNYRNEERVFNGFLSQAKALYVDELTTEVIERWRNERVSNVEKATVNRELKMFKRFLCRIKSQKYRYVS